MAKIKRQRVRDPVHGLITFRATGRAEDVRLDQTAWRLLNTPEFQRLRRIRQLGVSEFTFPGATHTRFAHSMGVFNTARHLVRLIADLLGAAFNGYRADVAVLAALLHDIGHGPFSHAFENAQKKRGTDKRHERWTADIIRNEEGAIRGILEDFRPGMTDEISDLLETDNPRDVYHAVVSSSFDADRLDYLRRDRLMTGSGAGAIDFDWLMDNIRTAEISLAGDEEDEEAPKVTTFCLHQKAQQAAEAFLLARYHLFEQVYLHKTTRGIETLISKLLAAVADATTAGEHGRLGLDDRDPLVLFFRPDGDTVRRYLALDDFQVWASIARMAESGQAGFQTLARRLLDRRLYHCLDIDTVWPAVPGETLEETDERRLTIVSKLDERLYAGGVGDVLKDVSPISAYGEVGADHTKAHKMLAIQMHDGSTREITHLSPTIRSIVRKRSLMRYYFPKAADRDRMVQGLTA